MKIPFICIILLVSIMTQAQDDSLLSTSYKNKSLQTLQLFFENWVSDTKPLTEGQFLGLSDTVKNVYEIFQAFYNPKEISKEGGSEFGNDIYKDSKYLILQDKIDFIIVDSLTSLITNENSIVDNIYLHNKVGNKYDSLKHFRPRIFFPDAKCVFLTDQYDSLLNKFLGNKYVKLGTGNIMSPAKSKGESEKRMKFLSNFVKIWYGHWGGYWQLHSYPFAERILIDKKFEIALIDYRMIYEGGYALLQKSDGEWKFIKAKRTWIE